MKKLATRVAYVERNCTEHDTRITANNESIEALNFELNELKTEIQSLKSANSRLDAEVYEQIDRSMRETLIINVWMDLKKLGKKPKLSFASYSSNYLTIMRMTHTHTTISTKISSELIVGRRRVKVPLPSL